MNMPSLLCLFAALAHVPAWAAEGMWTFDNPPLARMQQELGWAPSQAWLQHAMHASARLALGCSGAFVSASGLVLSNHHCAAECVEQLSSDTSDYLQAGFLAHSRREEKRCPGMEINRLDSITDVTEAMQKATAGRSGADFNSARDAAIARLSSECVGKAGASVRCDVVSLYHGGKYQVYRYHRFQDVRLVFVPEQAAAFFGGDPDNFNFPRYDLDVSLLRVYEGGQPAKVAEFLPVSATGPQAGEAVITSGHPGNTQREFSVASLLNVRDHVLPNNLIRLAEYRGLLTQFRTEDASARRLAADDLFLVENSLKSLRGQREALTDESLLRTKSEQEQALRRYVAAHPALQASTGTAWDEIAAALVQSRALREPVRQIEIGLAFNTGYFSLARTLVRAAAERARPNPQRLPEFTEARLPEAEARVLSPAPLYPRYETLKLAWSLSKMREALGADHALVRQVLGKASPQQLAEQMVGATVLGNVAERRRLWEGGAAAIAASNDPFIRLAATLDPTARTLRTEFENGIESVITRATERIAAARFAMLGTSIYPDATFTLRLSYGQVQGWNEAGKAVPPFTDIGGAFERATGADPFRLPASWHAARARLAPATPLNFASTNDIVGGNSGSPVINRAGEVVGVIFDGNIHSLGGTFGYDPSHNRAVAVDCAALLAALRHIYGAHELLRELGQP